MVNLEKLVTNILENHSEKEWIEFKRNNPEDVGEYVSALSNSAALYKQTYAYMIWGIEDNSKRIIGTVFDPHTHKIGAEDYVLYLSRMVSPAIDFRFDECKISDKRLVILTIPSSKSIPTSYKTTKYIRIGSNNKKLHEFPEKEKQLWEILSKSVFEQNLAKENLTAEEILSSLDYAGYLRLTGQEMPSTKTGIIELLGKEHFITSNTDTTFNITNLGAVLFANNLDDFDGLAAKKVRFIQYDDNSKLNAIQDRFFNRGYALSFESIVETISVLVPTKEIIGGAFRVNKPTYPQKAIREFIANALIHQDFSISGFPTIELYSDRLEITNSGSPLIDTLRLIDEPPQRRNEKLCAFMLRINICENRGSGIKRALQQIEEFLLPAPNFHHKTNNMIVVMFAPKSFKDMDRDDRIRACYQHASLLYIKGGQQLTNNSLRERFGPDVQAATISQIIGHTIAVNLIKPSDDTPGRRTAKYIPFWA